MRKSYLILLPLYLSFLLFCSCNENDAVVRALGAERIDKIDINGKQVSVTVVYTTPTPCWYYYRTETENDDLVFIAKVFGRDDGNPCTAVISSIKHDENISFLTPGDKLLRFWQTDTTYLDTTIVIL